MADEERTFQPGPVEANRTRMQGGGVGQSEMDAQGDPTRGTSATAADRTEPFDTEQGFNQSGDRPSTADFDIPEGTDQYDFDGRDNPEEDGGDPSLGAQQGQTHTRWPDHTEAERGQGPKTRARNKEINSGGL